MTNDRPISKTPAEKVPGTSWSSIRCRRIFRPGDKPIHSAKDRPSEFSTFSAKVLQVACIQLKFNGNL